LNDIDNLSENTSLRRQESTTDDMMKVVEEYGGFTIVKD